MVLYDFIVQRAYAAAATPIPLDGKSIVPIKALAFTGEKVVETLALLASVAAVWYMVWGGIQYMSAGSDTEKIRAAKTSIIDAMLGIVVVVIAYGIIQVSLTAGVFIRNNL